MLSRLKRIEIENFKSYQGLHIIGPLQSFTGVIGPNGSGKSNFMDAISFVMGEKMQSLRVKRLSDLIHGSVIGRPISKSASVTAVFTLGDDSEEEAVFQRSVRISSSEFKINDSVVSAPEYSAELEKLKINVKTKNFLVFQGAVDSIAMKNPKEMTALIEEISGSVTLKDEYEKLKKKMQEAQAELNFALQKKKRLNAERREAVVEKDEADKYSKIKDDLNNKLVEHQTFKAYHIERLMKICKQELKSKQTELDKVKQKKEKFEGILKDRKKDFGILNRELAKIEQDIREAQAEVSKKKPMFIKAKEEVAHFQKKVDGAYKTLDEAKKADDAKNKDIRKLTEELAEAQKEYETQLAIESQSQGIDIHLEDAQIRQYHKLKEEAARRSAIYMQALGSIIRDQKADQDRLDNISRLSKEAENKHSQKTHEKEEMVKRMNKLAEHIHTSEQALYDQNKQLKDLQQDVGSSKNKVDEVQNQLDEVLEQLGNAKTDEHEDRRKKKKQEIINHFKANYPGVYGRMINMCQPTYSRYNVAITKVLGKYMEAIVVDTERTARQCIQYLKEQMLDPETFLPLDYLLIKPSIRDRVRNITEPKGVKLLYDVLQYEPRDIKNAVMFATNNALVCESPEDANKVAYELESRYNAVALDGTFYQKSGIISGGTVDLARKAKRWDEKHVASLQVQKEKLANELREAMRKTRKESEIITVQSHISGLERRLSYAKGDMNATQTQIKKLENEIENLSEEIRKYGHDIEATKQDMQDREQHIENIKSKMNDVEDQVFADFCRKIAVKNIRQYEGRELRHHQARKQKCIEFQMQVDRIRSNLEFETNRDTHTNVTRWEGIVADLEGNLKIAKVKEARQREEIDKAMKILEEHESQKTSKKKELEKMDKELDQARKDVKAANKDMQSLQKNVMSIESKIEKLKSDRHAVLLHCKMEDIAIPLSVGNMEDIAATDTQTSSTGASSTLEQYERETTIQIDYSQLSDELLDLENDDEYKECENKLLKTISSLQEILRLIQAPNMKALEKLEQARGKLLLTNEEFNKLKRQNNEARAAFEKIKNVRSAKFNQCLDHVAREIDDIYKSLSQNQSAQAHLRVKNLEEPYLDGIDYDCVAPGKRFQRMSNLSGGEKTVAALALVFAIHTFQPAPFFVLDEVDAALDNTNIGKVAKFISEKTESLQIIVISLKEEFFTHAHGLIGIYPKPGHCLISQVVTMDLTGFDV